MSTDAISSNGALKKFGCDAIDVPRGDTWSKGSSYGGDSECWDVDIDVRMQKRENIKKKKLYMNRLLMMV